MIPLCCVPACLAVATAAFAQPPLQPPAQPPAQSPAAPPAQPSVQPPGTPAALPPGLVLGAKSEGIRRLLPVAKTVVIVQDTASYVAAIDLWRTNRRFPVLIDDGTLPGREAIARFVRAFKPTRVLRWTPKPEANSKPMMNWVADIDGVHAVVERAWTADGVTATKTGGTARVLAQFKAVDLPHTGVVVASKDDPAWVAGLALAAGRGQPIFWTTSSRKLDDSMTPADANALGNAIGEFCTQHGLAWKALGDDIDAVTITAAIPATVASANAGKLSTTDYVVRERGGNTRWAWAGQIFGQPAPAAYAAMAALFLQPNAAWLFDSYPTQGEWNNYDLTQAAEHLRKFGLAATLTDHPAGTESSWRSLVASPINAGLFFVNTKGNKEFFDLFTGKGLLGDIPLLVEPASVYFVHSFSAQFVGTRDTIAGRWIDRGATQYCGSCDEPGLSGFLPSPVVAARIASGFPWGAAVRYDNAPAWKISSFGDPLATLGAAASPSAEPPEFPGATDLSARVKELVKTNLPEALTMLVMLGRDEEAARLLAALAKTNDQLSSDSVLAAGLALARTGRSDDLLIALRVVRPDQFTRLPELRDALWMIATPRLKTAKDQALLALLRDNARPDQITRDMTELAEAWKQAFGGPSTLGMLQQIIAQQKNPAVQTEARKTLDAIRGTL